MSHWYSLIPNFNTSPKKFYDAIEQRLKDQQIPGLDLCRVEHSEGGVLSGKRQYLRLTRERLAFDICAAPFGTSFFFSCRFSIITSLKIFRFLLFILIFGGPVIGISYKFIGLVHTVLIALAVCLLLIALLCNLAYLELHNLDAFLLRDPLVGGLYERFFRKETYYREDTRFMYLDTVNAVVKASVEETTGAKGIKLVQYMEKTPLLHELYKPIQVNLPKTDITDVTA